MSTNYPYNFRSPFEGLYPKQQEKTENASLSASLFTPQAAQSAAQDKEKEKLEAHIRVLESNLKSGAETNELLLKRVENSSANYIKERVERSSQEKTAEYERRRAMQYQEYYNTANTKVAALNAELKAIKDRIQAQLSQPVEVGKEWFQKLNDHERKTLDHARLYAKCFGHGIVGHALYTLIDHLAGILDDKESIKTKYTYTTA